MKLNKRQFTLIELLISLTLTAIIVTSLGYFFSEVNHLNRTSEKLKQENFRLRYMEDRLMAIIPKAIAADDPLKDFYFFTSNASENPIKLGTASLIFTFDNGVNLVDPNFSNHVIGRLYLDKNGALTLAVWPSISRWQPNEPIPSKREVLLENVEELNFEFFSAPDKQRSFFEQNEKTPPGLQREEVEPKGTWIKDWRYSYYQLPTLLKISLKIKTDGGFAKKTMIFPLLKSNKYIVY